MMHLAKFILAALVVVGAIAAPVDVPAADVTGVAAQAAPTGDAHHSKPPAHPSKPPHPKPHPSKKPHPPPHSSKKPHPPHSKKPHPPSKSGHPKDAVATPEAADAEA